MEENFTVCDTVYKCAYSTTSVFLTGFEIVMSACTNTKSIEHIVERFLSNMACICHDAFRACVTDNAQLNY
jgi:hypothetical protein